MLVCYQNIDGVSYVDRERKPGKLAFQVDLVARPCLWGWHGSPTTSLASQKPKAHGSPWAQNQSQGPASGSGGESRDGRVWGFSPHFHRSCRSRRNRDQYCFCIPLSGLPRGQFHLWGWVGGTKVETVGGLRLGSRVEGVTMNWYSAMWGWGKVGLNDPPSQRPKLTCFFFSGDSRRRQV